MAQPGQSVWESRGASNKEYVVSPEMAKNLFYEYRHQSVIGKLSRPMGEMTIGTGPNSRTIDISSGSAVQSKTITSGDEVRFTLEQTVEGSPTYGDNPVRDGQYVPYLHSNMYVNKTDSPAFPVMEEMSSLRVRDIIKSPEASIRKQSTFYMAEQNIYDFYDGFFIGASRNLMASKTDGGRAVDLGAGAGVQVSPENIVVAGYGEIGSSSVVSGTAAYESALLTGLLSLENTPGDKISWDLIHQVPYWLQNDKKIRPHSGGQNDDARYIALTDPYLMARLTRVGGPLHEAWKTAQKRGQENPIFTPGAVELGNLTFIPDAYLAKYRPDVSNGTSIRWGGVASSNDRRSLTGTSLIAPMVIMGANAMFEANSGTMDITEDPGRHGKGRTISAHIKQSYMRSRFVPKDGRTGVVLNQASAVLFFYEDGLTW